MALSLLLSITLVLFAGRVQWGLSRAAEVQEVADASAMAGANVVARYATIAQVCDALVLTMGLAGLVTCGAALILATIPGAGEVASGMLDLGTSVLDARSSFARSAVSGLERLEGVVPTLVMLNSIAVVEANGADSLSYAGVAVPVPFEGMSDFSSLDTSMDTDGLERKARNMQDASDRLEEARKQVDDALARGWMADCGNRPRCMRERASTLAGLSGTQNQDYPSPETWTFGAALVRARTYYPVRRAVDVPEDGGVEALVDSCARKAFYDYAIEQLSTAYYIEHPDGRVDLFLPEFPHNTAEMRSTSIYTEQRWPCTDQGSRVLHATLACPGATGSAVGSASLAQLDAGEVSRCPVCEMDATDMGKVAAASTSIDNGFEHYWREVVLASRDYEAARNEYADVEDQLEGEAREGADLFERALEQLAVPRPHILPPGAWGCIALVARTETGQVPSSLGGSFLDAAQLPSGMAVSAAMLAPDESADGNSVLAHLFDGLTTRYPALPGALGDAGRLWGLLLESYDSSFNGLAQRSEAFLEQIDGVFGGSVGAWMRDTVSSIVREAGLEPADIRMLKPVLVSTASVFEKAGWDGVARAQQLILALGQSPDVGTILRTLGFDAPGTVGEGSVTIAELTIPGTDLVIPLEVDLSELAGMP
ncbi:MAG: hypothetical protein Q4D39_00810 [Coriobacteriaceae bacterium]|nr:hypothetical protein [Coriobacteriaceae bacterium]